MAAKERIDCLNAEKEIAEGFSHRKGELQHDPEIGLRMCSKWMPNEDAISDH
jgi:hypothetical protein